MVIIWAILMKHGGQERTTPIEPTHKLIEQVTMTQHIVVPMEELYYILCLSLSKNEFMRRLYKYLEAADIHIVERRRLLEVLKSFYKHLLGDKKQGRVIVISTGPLITLQRVEAIQTVGQLPFEFVAPEEVWAKLDAGVSAGHPQVDSAWLRICN